MGRQRVARLGLAAMGLPLLWALGCEQILGLDGPYNTSIISNSPNCTGDIEETCYSADPATLGVGVCKAGQRVCENGVWSPCYGEVVPTFETCTGEDIDCNGQVTCASEFAWGKSFGGPAEDSIRRVAVDKNNNIFITGIFGSSIDFGGGPLINAGGEDIFLAKLDPSGKHLWSISFGGAGNEHPTGIAVDSAGNVQVAGRFEQMIDFGDGPYTPPQNQRGMFLVKLGPNAEFLGSTAFFTSDLTPDSITFDQKDDLLIAVRFNGQVDFGGGIYGSQGDAPLAIVKFSGATGKHQWTRVYNGAFINSAFIDTDSSGNIGVAGSFGGKLNLGGNALDAAASDVYLAKLSPDGQHLWSTSFGGPKDDGVDGFAISPSNQWVILGGWGAAMPDDTITIGPETFTTHGGADIFLANYDSNGVFAWAKDLGSVGNGESANGIAIDSAGNLVISAVSNDPNTDFGFGPLGSAGLAILKFDSAAMPLWMRSSSTANVNPGLRGNIAIDAYRAIIVGGRFVTPLGFAGFSFPSAGGGDGYLMKIAP